MTRALEEPESADAGTRQRGEPGGPSGSRNAAVLTVGLLLIALNLRTGVASVGPVLTNIRDGIGLSATSASLLTTIPVVAFGAFAFLTPWLTRRLGMHQMLGFAMLVLAAGVTLRLQPSQASLFTGTIIVGAAIAVANVVLPAVIKHDLPERVGVMMGLYSTALFLSAALADGLAVPLLVATDGDWRRALAFWSVPAAVAFLAWTPEFFRTDRVSADTAALLPELGQPSFRGILTDRVAIAVTVLMGVQSTGYYATLTWLPTLLQDHGMSAHDAGWMLSYSAFPGIAASLVSPALARRARPTWVPIALSAVLDGVAYIGLALAPVGPAYLWMTLLGLGQGASISLSLSYIAWRSPDARHAGHVSTMAQGFGYLLASLGPVGFGALHSVSRNWTVPLIGLGALLVPQLIAGALASRERHVLEPRAAAGSSGRTPLAFTLLPQSQRPRGRHARGAAR